jgi:hypothetical protein
VAMMNDDQFNILLQRFDKQDDKLHELHGDFREFKGAMEVKVEQLEISAKNDKFWGRVQTVAVLPVVGLLHQIASHYGIIK